MGVGVGQGATGTWETETEAAARHPTMYRTAPHNKELFSPKYQ